MTRDYGHAGGGIQTTRLSAEERDARIRAERDAGALRYLTARDALDVAEILGLIESPPPVNPREGVQRKVAIRKGKSPPAGGAAAKTAAGRGTGADHA